MQEFISFFKYLATSNAINFIIMLVILGIIIAKINLKSSLNDAVAGVENSIKNSDNEKEKSENVLETSKKEFNRLPEVIQNLENEAELKVRVFKDKIEENTQKNIQDIQKNVERSLSIEEDKISNLLTGRTINASVALAQDNIRDLLKNNPELHLKFIDESLDELDKVKL